MAVVLSVVLITLCALLWDVGIVLQKLAVSDMPPITVGRGLARSLGAVLRSKRWMGGLAASAAGWGLFAAALTFTPISVARSIQGSGFVVLAFFSLLFLGHRLSVREWLGVLLVTAGIVALGIGEAAGATADRIAAARLLPSLLACLAVCAAVYTLRALLRIPLPWVVVFSIVAGLLLGVGDVATKLLLDEIQARAAMGWIAGAGLALILFYLSGFLILSRAYQHGRAIVVTAVSDLCSRLVAIFLGMAALGEALPAGREPRELEVLGYAAIFAGVVLLSRFSGEELAARISRSEDPS